MDAKMTVVIVILLALIGVGGFYAGQKYKIVPAETSVTTTPSPSAVGPEQIPTPTVDETATLVAAVRAGLVAEHGANANSMNISVSKIEGNFAQGGAIDPASVGGGMWLAAKTGGAWKLVWDGNGTISCENTDPYNFPTSMVPECWNEETGKLITR